MDRPCKRPEELFNTDTVAAMWQRACPRRPISTEQLLRLVEGLIGATYAAYRADERRPNVLRREIERLHAAAAKGEHPKLACHLNGLSPSARALLRVRAMNRVRRIEREIAWASAPILGQQRTALHQLIQLCGDTKAPPGSAAAQPGAEDTRLLRTNRGIFDELMSEGGLGDVACEVVIDLCQRGSEVAGGRRRRWRPRIAGPAMRQRAKRKVAGEVFIAWLQYTWWGAMGEMPPLTASATRPGPFARFAKLALETAGMRHFSAVEVINDLHRARVHNAEPVARSDDEPDL